MGRILKSPQFAILKIGQKGTFWWKFDKKCYLWLTLGLTVAKVVCKGDFLAHKNWWNTFLSLAALEGDDLVSAGWVLFNLGGDFGTTGDFSFGPELSLSSSSSGGTFRGSWKSGSKCLWICLYMSRAFGPLGPSASLNDERFYHSFYAMLSSNKNNLKIWIKISLRGRGWFAIRFRHSSNMTFPSGLPPKKTLKAEKWSLLATNLPYKWFPFVCFPLVSRHNKFLLCRKNLKGNKNE